MSWSKVDFCSVSGFGFSAEFFDSSGWGLLLYLFFNPHVIFLIGWDEKYLKHSIGKITLKIFFRKLIFFLLAILRFVTCTILCTIMLLNTMCNLFLVCIKNFYELFM
jgi:hypothetical protein